MSATLCQVFQASHLERFTNILCARSHMQARLIENEVIPCAICNHVASEGLSEGVPIQNNRFGVPPFPDVISS